MMTPASVCFSRQVLISRQKACLPGDSPQGAFMEFENWLLFHCRSPFTIGEMEDHKTTVHIVYISTSTMLPVELKPEPTTDTEPEPTRMAAPEPLHEASPGAWARKHVWPGVWAGIIHSSGHVVYKGMEWSHFCQGWCKCADSKSLGVMSLQG